MRLAALIQTALCPPGLGGLDSQCAPLAEVIKQGLLAGLSARRIYQDLVAEPVSLGLVR